MQNDVTVFILYNNSSEIPPAFSFNNLDYGQLSKNKDEKYYGKFKGLIRIVEKEKKLDYEQEIKKCQEQGGIEKMKNLNIYEKLQKKLITKNEIVVRLYILELNQLARRDAFSDSDPYIKIYLNDKEVINERKNYPYKRRNSK